MIFENIDQITPELFLRVYILDKWSEKNLEHLSEIISSKSEIKIPSDAANSEYLILKRSQSDCFYLIADANNLCWKNRLLITNELSTRVETHHPEMAFEKILEKVGGIIQDSYMTVTEKIIMEAKPKSK